mgnify:CR=1 FL=1
MKRPLSFFKDKLIWTTKEDRNGLAFIGTSSNFDNLWRATSGFFNNKFGRTAFIGGEVINVGDWGSFDRAANEIDLISFNVFDNHNLFLGKEMKGKVASSFS